MRCCLKNYILNIYCDRIFNLVHKFLEEWTTFDNEPVNFSSRCDTSGLVAPVPVRLTPEDSLFLSSTAQAGNKVQHLQLKSIQRPKLSGQQPKVSLGTIAPPPVIHRLNKKVYCQLPFDANLNCVLAPETKDSC